jgi:DNA primase
LANRLAHEVLGRSLDELPPQTRRLLLMIDEHVSTECDRQKMERSDYRFSRRAVREFTGWGDTQLKVHLHRLEEMEYLLIHRGGRGQSFVYELVFTRQADSGRPVLPGLIDLESLRSPGYDGNKSGPEVRLSGSGRGHVGGVSAAAKTAPAPASMRVTDDVEFDIAENTYTGAHRNGQYVLTMAGVK